MSLIFKDKLMNILFSFRIIELFLALAFLIHVYFAGVFEFNFLSLSTPSSFQVQFGLRADELSTMLLLMISILSACIFRFSIRYLDGDSCKNKFFIYYQTTIFFVMLLVLSNNILMFYLAWLGISMSFHKLLLLYPDRPKAILAARKKWIISRLGDTCLFGGICLTYFFYHSLNFSELVDIANHAQTLNSPSHQKYFSLIGICFALGALAKSAQFPFHFWLPETMETPTPVSALMHAGIINAGGFLILRFSPILVHAHWAHAILILFGSLSAVLGALIMMNQTDFKKQLAYSTMSQMGFMMVQCGIGAYTSALFHILAHGFYKAYGFLSAASVIHSPKASKRNLSNLGVGVSFFVATSLIFISFHTELKHISQSQIICFSILSLALTQIIGSRKDLFNSLSKNFIYTFSYFSFILFLYFFFEYSLSDKFKRIMPSSFDTSALNLTAVLLAVIFFISGIIIAKILQNISTPSAKKIYLFFLNGIYFPTLTKKYFEKK